MPLKTDVRLLTAALGISVDTASNWSTVNPILPKGTMAMASDTGVIKVGDGVAHYNDLAVRVDATLTQAQRVMLDKVNTANGVVQLDATGAIPMSLMPSGVVSGSVKFVADIAARDALTGNQRDGLIVVLNAVGDPTVTKDSAQYVWNGTWVKVGEKESMDIDLVPYFNVTTDTLDRIAAGTNYIHFTPDMKAAYDLVVSQAVRKGDQIDELVDSANFVKMLPAERVALAGLQSGPDSAILISDTVFISSGDAAFLASLQE